ncbi:uncharacterized protein EHS24_003298 [Apiotrichum porosum]|uniref:Uncharacterized protein n=1 Tax=Apiotrichum porosum TaxID=105984 RepID=A0A427XEK1_9TREE|nr:uncharacterized protein EHS24_003298 [Apiotrichum porosum]RSH77339.1 hypothetical protein EHS24_003298 [Apiotrichum porosum]
MPVTFAPAPEHQRRLSASSPFPGRIMTSLVPSDPPVHKHKHRSSSSSSRRGSAPRVPATGVPGPVPEDPFEESGVARAEGTTTQSAYERVTNSPQEERMPLYAVDEEDAERQPLLGDDGPRPDVQWALTLGITVAIAAITFLILFVWKLTEPAPESDNGGA